MKCLLNKHRIITIIIDLALLVAGFVLKPATVFMLTKLPHCAFYEQGITCPSCGGTRFVYNFMQGNFQAAWNYHQYFFVLSVYIILVLIVMNLGYLFEIKVCKAFLWKMVSPIMIIVCAVAFFAFGFIRGTVVLLA